MSELTHYSDRELGTLLHLALNNDDDDDDDEEEEDDDDYYYIYSY